MKALMMKDILMVWKNMKMILILIGVFLIYKDMYLFAIMMAMTIPLSLNSFDEYSKWDSFSKMLPYKVSEIVISRYLLTYAMVTIVSVLTFIVIVIKSAIFSEAIEVQHLISLAVMFSGGFVLSATNFPIIYKLGSAKGSLGFMGLTFLFIAVMSFWQENFLSLLSKFISSPLAIIIAIALIIVLNILSILLSISINKAKK